MMLLDHTSDVWRNTALGTNGRKQLTPLHEGLSCLFMPMNAPAAITNGFTVGRGYTAFYDVDADIKVGDRLVWSGKNLMVKAVMPWDVGMSSVSHLRVFCEQDVS